MADRDRSIIEGVITDLLECYGVEMDPEVIDALVDSLIGAQLLMAGDSEESEEYLLGMEDFMADYVPEDWAQDDSEED